jgi:formylglycine-generating enzyme required for sulfatase activity
VSVREDGTATRRREGLAYWAADPDARRLIAHLSDAAAERPAGAKNRLLVTGTEAAPSVEVAHEALLREWATLATWIEERRDALRLRERLETEAKAWAAAKRPDPLRWRHERLAPARALLTEADLLAELERDPIAADFVTPEPDWLLAELLCAATAHDRREDIGLRLAEIGDPRPGVGVVDGVPDIQWCPIPAGKVTIEEYGCFSGGRRRFQVKPFHMAAYPITHSQFEAFLAAEDGFRSDRWWEDDLLRKDPVAGRIRRYGNYPATHVSWYDATAFCRWLSARLGFEVRLPDEWEWQWAAQSARKALSYLWRSEREDGRANAEEAGIGRTTAVGMYPSGGSDQGVYDLGGNVWEWCRDDPCPNVTKAHVDESLVITESWISPSRTLRGGSWLFAQASTHAAFRKAAHQLYRLADTGFRVVCVSPIHPEG